MVVVIAASTSATILSGVVLLIGGALFDYFVRDPIEQRRQLRREVCELLRKLEDAELHEDNAYLSSKNLPDTVLFAGKNT